MYTAISKSSTYVIDGDIGSKKEETNKYNQADSVETGYRCNNFGIEM